MPLGPEGKKLNKIGHKGGTNDVSKQTRDGFDLFIL